MEVGVLARTNPLEDPGPKPKIDDLEIRMLCFHLSKSFY